MLPDIRAIGYKAAWYAFGFFMLCVYAAIAITNGSFFHREDEKQRLEFALARDRIWNLDKTYEGLFHRFFALRSGLQFHYVTSQPQNAASPKPLVIFLHGYPDSYSVWRSLFQSKVLKNEANLVAVDLPGFGGSDSFPPYSATTVLEALTEFIVGMRGLYNIDDVDSGHGSTDSSENSTTSKVYVVGHDWGCVLAYRLAAGAPALADRFILTNGPLPELVLSNKNRISAFIHKASHALRESPAETRHHLPKIIRSIVPLIHQAFRLGYIPAFHLPALFVRYLLSGGNRSFMRGIHQLATGEHNSELDQASFLAGCLGPGIEECKTKVTVANETNPQTFPAAVVRRVTQNNSAYEATEYYRSGTATDPWDKSLETIAALYDIETNTRAYSPRRHSSGSALFQEQYEGALGAPATIVWGAMDPILTRQFCLDGIQDYLAKGSDVIVLPRTGHWTPSEVEGRKALQRVVEWAVRGEPRESLGEAVKEVYEDAYVSVSR